MPFSCKELPQPALLYKKFLLNTSKINFMLKPSDGYVNYRLLCAANADEDHNEGRAEHVTKRNLV